MADRARPPAIIVMGVAGAGKTAVGERLAARLGVPLIEGNDALAALAGVVRAR